MLLQIKSAVENVNGVDTDCYGIYCGDEMICTVSVFDYRSARRQVQDYNAVIEHQMRAIIDQARHKAASIKALLICSKLNQSREGLTRKTIIAANHCRRLEH